MIQVSLSAFLLFGLITSLQREESLSHTHTHDHAVGSKESGSEIESLATTLSLDARVKCTAGGG